MIQMWENESSGAVRCVNITQPLAHFFDLTEKQDAMKTTRECSVDDCERGGQLRRGLCQHHYNRWYALQPREPRTESCSIADCGRPVDRRGWCATHYTRWWRHGDPTKVLPNSKLLRPGEQHVQWVGDEISYTGMHRRLRAQRGRASLHICAKCESPAAQWAYDHNDVNERSCTDTRGRVLPFSVDLGHYLALCHSCHVRFDLETKRSRQ